MTPFAPLLPSARQPQPRCVAGFGLPSADQLPHWFGGHLFLRREELRHPIEPPQATRSSRVRIGSSGFIRASFMSYFCEMCAGSIDVPTGTDVCALCEQKAA